MKSIFRELEEAYKVAEVLPDKELRIKALEEVESYINSGVWYSGRDKEEFLRNYRLPMEEYSKRTGRSEDNIRLIIKRASDKVRKRIGYNRINTILHGTQKEVLEIMSILKWGTKNYIVDRLVINDIVNSISQYRSVSEDYLLEDLEREIKFLNEYSLQRMKSKMQMLDKNKLTYIFRILTSNEGCDLELKYMLLKNVFNIERNERK